MNSSFKTLLFSAAASGLPTGTVVCAHASILAEGTQSLVKATTNAGYPSKPEAMKQ